MEFEDILLEVGDYGKYQRDLILIFLVPAASLLPFFTMNVLFMVSVPDHWCRVPELESFNLSTTQQRSLISPPEEHCLRYDVNFTEILDLANYTVPNGTTTRPCEHGWQFDQTYWDSTAATKWDMVCEDYHYTSFVLTMYNVGSIIGTPIYGSLSDKIGRKITFFITIVINAATAIVSVLMSDFTAFVVMKTLNGTLMPSVFQLPYIIRLVRCHSVVLMIQFVAQCTGVSTSPQPQSGVAARLNLYRYEGKGPRPLLNLNALQNLVESLPKRMHAIIRAREVLEIVAPEMRTRMNGVVNLSWTIGVCILPLIAYYSRTWVILGLLTSSVTVIYLLYYTFLPESPRWLVSQERYEEAAVIMCKIAEKNGNIPDKNDLTQKLEKLGEKTQKEKTEDGVQNSSLDLLRYPQLRKKFLIITFCWMADIMSYYGLQLNITNLSGNEFVNFFLLGVVEIPGYITSWYFMERFGRRWCTAAGFMCTGLVCMLTAIDFPNSDIICSMVGKYFASAAFMATYQQSSELYPTVVRSLGMGMSSTVAMLITLVVPYVVYLSVYGKAIPFIIIGATGILAGIAAAFLPETLNENLPQTISDAEKFGLEQKFFSWNRRRHSVSHERAASLKIKPIPMETIEEGSGEKIHRSSQNQINSDFAAGYENSCVSVESVRAINEGADSTRKRNSAASLTKEPYPIDAAPDSPLRRISYPGNHQGKNIVTSETEASNHSSDKSRKRSSEGLENDKDKPFNKAPINSGDKDCDEKFS